MLFGDYFLLISWMGGAEILNFPPWALKSHKTAPKPQ